MTTTHTGCRTPEGSTTILSRPLPRAFGSLLAATLAVVAVSGCTGVSRDEPGHDAASPSVAADEGPLAEQTVVIDPGHNGGNADAAAKISSPVPAGPETKECDTVGATGVDGYPEHEFTWEFAQDLRSALESEGATVILTREDNEGVGPCVNERAEIGNQADADAAISIHADGAGGDGRGFHVIAPGEIEGYTEDIVAPSRQLAEDVRDSLHDETGHPYADYIGEDGVDVRTDLGGLNLSTVPKIFLELGNMGNAEDAELLRDEQWRTEAAEAIAAGKSHFLLRE